MDRGKQVLLTAIAVVIFCNAVLSIVAHQKGSGNTGSDESPNICGKETTQSEQSALGGRVTLAGSTSMEKMLNAMAECFMLRYPEVSVTAEFTGSSAGIEALLAGSAAIGCSSRALTERERNLGAVEHIAAMDVIAVITDYANPVTALTKEQLCDIYTGKIKNWREVGGPDEAVVVVGREAGSGTRQAFEETLGIAGECVYANELDSTGAVVARAVTIPGVIGYVSLDVTGDKVRVISIDGIEPSAESVSAGDYLLVRPFVLVTKGMVDEQSREVQAFFAFLRSEEGRKVMRQIGLFPL